MLCRWKRPLQQLHRPQCPLQKLKISWDPSLVKLQTLDAKVFNSRFHTLPSPVVMMIMLSCVPIAEYAYQQNVVLAT